jgi:glycosyltransferase involved in cell wall biosynthesis
VANARMPTEKAHGIQIAKMCEAFIMQGIDVVLIVPRRKTHAQTLKDFYGLSCDIPLLRLPALDLYAFGRFGFVVSSLSFIASYLMYLGWHVVRGEKFLLYTVDMDTFSGTLLPIFGRPVVSEVHNALPKSIALEYFFKRARGVVAINAHIKEELMRTFALPPERIAIEPNGVDIKAFEKSVSKEEARAALALPSGPIVLYLGRFYVWKGLDILADAFKDTTDVACYVVGGTSDAFMQIIGRSALPTALHIMGEVRPQEVPLWLAAADVLLVLGTAHNESSYRYTAPMKVFEYMAARRPIVASATPALLDIVGKKEALWYEPDDARDLIAKVRQSVSSSHLVQVDAAYRHAERQSWPARAKRILEFLAI